VDEDALTAKYRVCSDFKGGLDNGLPLFCCSNFTSPNPSPRLVALFQHITAETIISPPPRDEAFAKATPDKASATVVMKTREIELHRVG